MEEIKIPEQLLKFMYELNDQINKERLSNVKKAYYQKNKEKFKLKNKKYRDGHTTSGE